MIVSLSKSKNIFGSNKKKLFKCILIILLILCIAIGSYFFISPILQGPIQNYNEKRDREFITSSLKNDWYWLVENPEFSTDFMLETMSPNKSNPKYFGKNNIKVLLKDNKPVAFITYYKKNFYTAQIQFVYVSNENRGKGYAGQMIKYAFKDLKKQGVLNVKIVTRTINKPAIKAYTKLGFKEVLRDDGFVYFEKRI